MKALRPHWPAWAEHLRYWKMDTFAAWLLEAGGPLTLLSAQALYFASPFIDETQADSLAQMLEEPEELGAFISYLREESSA